MTQAARDSTPPRWRAADRSVVIQIVALTVVATALRAPGLAPSSLWIDDAWVAYAHRAGWAEITEIGLSAPGFSALLKAWFSLVGFSEITAQMLPFIAGVAAPALTFWILRSRVRAAVAISAAGWMVLAPVHVEYSTRVKQYSIEVIVALVMVHLAWKLVDEPSDLRRWRQLSLVSTVAVVFSFPLASVAAAACAVPLAIHLWRVRRVDLRLAWLVVPATVTAGWFVIVIRHRQYPDLRRFWQPFFVRTDAGLGSPSPGPVRTRAPLPATLSVVVVSVAVAVLAWRRPALFAITGLPLLAALILAIAERAPLGGGRTDLYLLGGLILATAIGANEGISLIVKVEHGRLVTGGLALLSVAAALLGLARYDVPSYPKEDIRPLVADLDERREPTDVVLVYHNAKWAFATYTDLGVEVRPVSGPYDLVFDDPQVLRQIYPSTEERLQHSVEEANDLGRRIWLIGCHFEPSWGQTVEALEGTGRSISFSLDRPGARLMLFE